MRNMKSALKGWLGELGIKIAASVALPSSRYHKLHNVTLKTDRGSTQIDHIVVSKHGIFVVETKFMKGWIYGSQYDKEWTQKFPRSSYRFQNPLRQNYAHVKALQAILPEIDPETIHSVISMCGEHKIKTPMPPNVTRGAWYVRYVRGFSAVEFTDEQVAAAIKTIEAARLPATRATQQKHVDSLRRRHESANDTQKPINPPNSELVTTSKLASLLKISTDEMLAQLEATGFLATHGHKYRITQAGRDAGGLWKPSKFGGYYLWPSTFVSTLPAPSKLD